MTPQVMGILVGVATRNIVQLQVPVGRSPGSWPSHVCSAGYTPAARLPPINLIQAEKGRQV